jgi:hypothetical protein
VNRVSSNWGIWSALSLRRNGTFERVDPVSSIGATIGGSTCCKSYEARDYDLVCPARTAASAAMYRATIAVGM